MAGRHARPPSQLCTRCEDEPRRPGQRWGNNCYAAYMVGWRKRRKQATVVVSDEERAILEAYRAAHHGGAAAE